MQECMKREVPQGQARCVKSLVWNLFRLMNAQSLLQIASDVQSSLLVE